MMAVLLLAFYIMELLRVSCPHGHRIASTDALPKTFIKALLMLVAFDVGHVKRG